MKGPKFNASLTRANQASDVRMARMLATARQAGMPMVKQKLIEDVLRPFTHVLNFSQLENADPVEINEGLASLTASMLVEMMLRMMPTSTPPAIVGLFVTDFIEDVNRQIVDAVNANYQSGLALADPAPPPAGGTVQ